MVLWWVLLGCVLLWCDVVLCYAVFYGRRNLTKNPSLKLSGKKNCLCTNPITLHPADAAPRYPAKAKAQDLASCLPPNIRPGRGGRRAAFKIRLTPCCQHGRMCHVSTQLHISTTHPALLEHVETNKNLVNMSLITLNPKPLNPKPYTAYTLKEAPSMGRREARGASVWDVKLQTLPILSMVVPFFGLTNLMFRIRKR